MIPEIDKNQPIKYNGVIEPYYNIFEVIIPNYAAIMQNYAAIMPNYTAITAPKYAAITQQIII